MSDADINMSSNGCVIITSVNSPTSTTFSVTAQSISAACNSGHSKIGCFPPPSSCGPATRSNFSAASVAVADQSDCRYHRGLLQFHADYADRHFPAQHQFAANAAVRRRVLLKGRQCMRVRFFSREDGQVILWLAFGLPVLILFASHGDRYGRYLSAES